MSFLSTLKKINWSIFFFLVVYSVVSIRIKVRLILTRIGHRTHLRKALFNKNFFILRIQTQNFRIREEQPIHRCNISFDGNWSIFKASTCRSMVVFTLWRHVNIQIYCYNLYSSISQQLGLL